MHGEGFFFKGRMKKKLTFSLDIPHTLSSSCDSPEQRSVRGQPSEGSQYHRPLGISLYLFSCLLLPDKAL